MNQISIPMSPGELLDKITILEIKSVQITDTTKKSNVDHELSLLNKIWAESVTDDDIISALRKELKSINEMLWKIEDDIRDEERAKQFGDKFIDLARKVYMTNDLRADVKKRINLHLKSDIVEEKSYQDYK